MREKLTQLLNKEIVSIDKLFGEASSRVYSRIQTKDGEHFVVMAMPEGKMSASEEITNLKEAPKELPFINVQKYLNSLGLPVPQIECFSEKDRLLVLEDLGDTKLADVPSVDWYKKAIDLLITMQEKTKAGGDSIAFQRSFDATLLNWEFDHFLEYYVGEKSDDDFQKETRKITEELVKLPQTFVHRDFQSRNLMIHNDQLILIDFQDALLGPKPYDLVALLRDSYIDLTKSLDELVGYYCEKAGEELETFRRAFDLQTVQRKMKDAGGFVFIDQVKKNPNFLPFIPISLRYVREALERLPEYSSLQKWIQK